MANAVVQLPVGYFPDPSKGRPLWNAKIYVGTIDLDPRTSANQKVVTGRQENGTEVALAQPVRTNSGGVPVDGAGNVVTLLVDGAYAMAVDDKNDNQKYYFANVLAGAPITFADNPILYRDTVAIAVADGWLSVGQVIRTKGYHSENDGGGAEYIIVAGGTGTPDGGSYIDMSNGNQLELKKSSSISVNAFGAIENTDISSAITSALSFLPATGRLTATPANYIINSDVITNEKGRPNIGTFEIDFTGSIFTGTGNFIFDSCKNLIITGITHANSNLELRGVWYSKFTQCRASKLLLAQNAGTAFTDVYWDSFDNCVFQTIVRGATAFHVNAITCNDTILRGDNQQGFTSSANYCIEVNGTGNFQNFMFNGGDISYPTIGLINITSTADVEINLRGVYFDSKPPVLSGFAANQYIKTEDCHVLGKIIQEAEFVSALRAAQDFKGKVNSTGWQPNKPTNLIPNGDFFQTITSYASSGGGPIGSFLGTTTAFADATIGNYINLNVGAGDQTATLCQFRTIDIEIEGKYTGVIIARDANAIGRTLNFSVNSQFFDATIGADWTVITMAAQSNVAAGAVSNILMRSQDGQGYNLDIRYVGFHLGTNPPLMCPQDHRITSIEELRANKIIMGGKNPVTSRPTISSGTGSPEGVIVASIGSIYMRSDGGAGTALFIKESGTGNTGWISK